MHSREAPPVLGMEVSGLYPQQDKGQEEAGEIRESDESLELEYEWLQRSRQAFESSTTWFDSEIRQRVEKNIAHFKSQHSKASKYNSSTFGARSKVFRPKTRAMIRRSEAATAVALFATSDVVNIEAWNDADPGQQIEAAVKQAVMQYRLTESIPWFQTVVGAVQDGSVTGVCISHQYWRYNSLIQRRKESAFAEDGSEVMQDVEEEVQIENRPAVDLIPIENFRVDPACDWRDPARTSPYLIYLVPTYVGEARRLAASGQGYLPEGESAMWAMCESDYDSIRTIRAGGSVDKYANSGSVSDYRTVWVRKHYHRIDNEDWYWETINDVVLFREPVRLTSAYPFLQEGERPFVIGSLTIQTGQVIPESKAELVSPIQEEVNDLANLQLDGTKNALFGRWSVLRGRAVDTTTLKAGIPQSIISTDNHDALKELKQSDVPASVFQSTDRLNLDFDEVAGNFSLASVASNKSMNETVGGMNLLSADASQVAEYEIRVFVETWVQPVLQQVLAMEAVYEDDQFVLSKVAASQNVTPEQVQQALQSYGKVRVDVGFNATSPEKRIGRLMLGLKTIFTLFPEKSQQSDSFEIIKEVMGALGYKDGSRFFPRDENQDPRVAQLEQQVQQLTAMVEGKQMDLQSRERVAEIGANARVQTAQLTSRVTWELGLITAAIKRKETALSEVDRMLDMELTDIKRGELILQREALSHEISESNRQFQHVVRSSDADRNVKKGEIATKAAGKDGKNPPAKKAGDGPKDMPGEDKAGTIARDRYGTVPFAEG